MMSLLDDNNNSDSLSLAQDDEMYTKLNERSELEAFRNQYSDSELDDMAERYRSLWEPAFITNHERTAPLHPWKVLKMVRRAYAEMENDGDWPDLPRRHALRVVKDEYAEKWRSLAYGGVREE